MILVLAIIVVIVVICVFYHYAKEENCFIDEDRTIIAGKQIHKATLEGKLENIKKMVIQNDNDLLLKVITQEEHQKQLANYNSQIDEIEKELAFMKQKGKNL